MLKGDICLSGGAKGSDAQWGMMAGRYGHSVIHWSFGNHKVFAPEQEMVRLSDEQLLIADPFLEKAAKTIKRPYPGNRSEFVKNLLRRNYYQVAWSNALYGVGSIKNGLVQGGTGWAVQMFLDINAAKAQFEPLDLYFYEQNQEVWYRWAGGWKALEGQPPPPSGIWAGIGTRELNDSGKWAIRQLLGWPKPE